MSNTLNKDIEYELNTVQCVTVAKYMYEEWEKAMTPPLLIWKSFPDWLELLTPKPQANTVAEKPCKLCSGTGTTIIKGVKHVCISCLGIGSGDKW